jgi:hypothetical protein
MLEAIILGFVAGVFGGNGIPHFFRGITRRSYPMVFSAKPVPNLVVGWIALTLTPLFFLPKSVHEHYVATYCSGMVGLLLIGLFHAGPGAFGKTQSDSNG